MPESAKRRKASKKILNYIADQQKQEHPKDTKADVMRYCEKESICSQPVAHSVIIDLANGHKINVLKDKPNSQTHHLVINDKDEFSRLNVEIDKLYLLANNLTKIVPVNAKMLENIRNRSPKRHNIFDTDFRNLLHLAQLDLFTRISGISSNIHYNIKSTNDREVLNLRLIEVLNASDKLSQVIQVEVERGAKETIDKMKEVHVVKGTTWANIFDGIITTMRNSY